LKPAATETKPAFAGWLSMVRSSGSGSSWGRRSGVWGRLPFLRCVAAGVGCSALAGSFSHDGKDLHPVWRGPPVETGGYGNKARLRGLALDGEGLRRWLCQSLRPPAALPGSGCCRVRLKVLKEKTNRLRLSTRSVGFVRITSDPLVGRLHEAGEVRSPLSHSTAGPTAAEAGCL
jgi:hypothetical protein